MGAHHTHASEHHNAMRVTPALALAAIGCILGGGCSNNTSSTSEGTSATLIANTTSSTGQAECVAPPQTEIDRVSPVAMSVEPNPVSAGDRATLTMQGDGLDDATTGPGVEWQCWEGSSWITTNYQVVLGFGGNPSTQLIEPGTDSTIPAIALHVPNEHPIVIPPVTPGRYRLVTQITDTDTSHTAFVIVEVT